MTTLVCIACAEETNSRSNRLKHSTCDDCLTANPIILDVGEFRCACEMVGHDKSKLKPTPPIPAETEAAFKTIVEIMDKRSKGLDDLYYYWDEEELLELSEWCSKRLDHIRDIERDRSSDE